MCCCRRSLRQMCCRRGATVALPLGMSGNHTACGSHAPSQDVPHPPACPSGPPSVVLSSNLTCAACARSPCVLRVIKDVPKAQCAGNSHVNLRQEPTSPGMSRYSARGCQPVQPSVHPMPGGGYPPTRNLRVVCPTVWSSKTQACAVASATVAPPLSCWCRRCNAWVGRMRGIRLRETVASLYWG